MTTFTESFSSFAAEKCGLDDEVGRKKSVPLKTPASKAVLVTKKVAKKSVLKVQKTAVESKPSAAPGKLCKLEVLCALSPTKRRPLVRSRSRSVSRSLLQLGGI